MDKFKLHAILFGVAIVVTTLILSSPVDASDKFEYKRSKSGVELWSNSCVRCHNLRSPAERSDKEWEVIMHHMRLRANLTKEEHGKILDFLKSAN